MQPFKKWGLYFIVQQVSDPDTEIESLKLIGLKGLLLSVLCIYYTYIAYTLFFSP